MVPYKLVSFFYFSKKRHWNFDRFSIEVKLALESMDIEAILILPVHEHEIPFHLYMSSSSFINVLYGFFFCLYVFSVAISLVKLIFILFLILL